MKSHLKKAQGEKKKERKKAQGVGYGNDFLDTTPKA